MQCLTKITQTDTHTCAWMREHRHAKKRGYMCADNVGNSGNAHIEPPVDHPNG